MKTRGFKIFFSSLSLCCLWAWGFWGVCFVLFSFYGWGKEELWFGKNLTNACSMS